jgi:hypothetical protein
MVSATGTCPPRPKFETKRNIASDGTFQDNAVSPVKIEKIPIVVLKDVRRPM